MTTFLSLHIWQNNGSSERERAGLNLDYLCEWVLVTFFHFWVQKVPISVVFEQTVDFEGGTTPAARNC